MMKVPVSGGEAVDIIGPAGYSGFESPDGKHLLYDFESGGVWSIWRVPLEGGPGAPVIKIGQAPKNWTVTKAGIYFFDSDAKSQPAIKFHSFATGQTKPIAAVVKDRGSGGLTVSPDGRWVLYTQLEGSYSSDIMLVENFR